MTFKEYVLHQLREMRRELDVAIEDLSAEDFTSFEPVGHWPVGWIAEHCTEVADSKLVAPVAGKRLHEYEEHVLHWPKREPVPGDSYPAPQEIRTRWLEVCDWIVGHVESIDESALQESPAGQPYIDSILLVINHTNAHLRSLWCVLGERRVDHKFAEQGPFLA